MLHNVGEAHAGGAGITLIGCILGSICSLKCKHCVEHVPYIAKENKRFIPKETILRDIQTLAAACEFVAVLDLVGGEPFLHPELPEIVSEVRKISNIGIVNVFTNGTIMPDKALLESLTMDFCTVDLSNYSKNLSVQQRERIINTEKTLVDAGVTMFRAKNFSWFDTLSFEKNDDSEELLKERYGKCGLRDCYRLYDGKLFRCLHHYAGYVTGNIPLDNSVVNVHEDNETLVERLNTFVSLPYIEACRYCNMPYKAQSVSSGIQLE
jgi:MoaA/NifB/PqqE/SkfB family radical SAM enzyme